MSTSDEETATAYDQYVAMVEKYRAGDATVSIDDVEESYSHYLSLRYKFRDFTEPPLQRIFLEARESASVSTHEGGVANSIFLFIFTVFALAATVWVYGSLLYEFCQIFSQVNIRLWMQT